MGCCFSSPAGSNSPYPGGTSGSSRHINPTTQTTDGAQHALPAAHAHAHAHAHRRRREQQPLDQHINKPLRRHVWKSRHRQWTRAALDRERADFFDTRVTGHPEIWQTLHAALQVLWTPESNVDDASGGLATAQSIITAAEITLPTGDLAQGAYDALGNYYALHEWVVSDPSNMAEDPEETGVRQADEDSKPDKDAIIASEAAIEEVEDEEEALRRREEKGKAVADDREQITVMARLSETSQDIKVRIGKNESVRSLARKIGEEAGLPANKVVRIAYMGKILKETTPLSTQGWKRGHIVNALVFVR